ncbi:MAG: SusC/RagA family TonB-linked outer membrane protein [Prevotellaceae bacterium]|jgi:TonB-linked SusC/RagA family outer membrane protein|nr:SusC/RagA family TonB-linked outer membrane protein [Prevotellaceae bacterium]
MKKLFVFSAILCMVAGLADAQSRKVSGTVYYFGSSTPVAGVSVIVKGTTVGINTGSDGQFTVNVPASSRILQFSLVGLKTEEIEAVDGMVVYLENASEELDEIVVTAMGISREKKALGYATQDVKSDMLQMTGNSDLTKSLQGKVAGIDLKTSSGMPGASSQIVIRGARSFDGDNTPLYVVDGMPISSIADYSTLNSVTGSDIANRAIDIDPNDIESVNILRGQAAAALYGIGASNGVIIITTKSGKGKPLGKVNVSLTQTTSFDVVSRHPDFQQVWAQGSGGSYIDNSSMSWGPKITDLPNDPKYGGNERGHAGLYQVKQLIDGGYKDADTWVKPDVYDNWSDYFETGVNSTTSLLLSKAEETGHFAIGLSYTDQTGIALNTGMKRWNGKANGEKKLNKSFTAGFSANFANTTIDKLTGANDGSLVGVMNAPVSYNLKGIPMHKPGDPYSQIYYRTVNNFDNPYWIAKNNTFNENTNRFFGDMYVQYQANFAANHKLTVKYQLGADAYTTHYQDIFGYGHAGKQGNINNYGITKFNYNSLLTANYDWKITDDLDFNLVTGNELKDTRTKYYDDFGSNFNFGGWNHISNVTSVKSDERQWRERNVGFFGSMSLSWKNMLYLNVTGRQDHVSTMPVNNRTFFYPSTSLGFVFSELLRNFDWLSFGKVRASYAEVGQAGKYLNNYYYSPSYGGGFWQGEPIIYPVDGVNSYIQYSKKYDPNLKPQNTKSWELGLTLNFLNGRIGVDYTYAAQNTVDQIFEVPLPTSTGAEAMVTNGGQMKTETHEFTLNLVPVQIKDFKWEVNLNYSYLDNRVISLRDGVNIITLGGFTEPQICANINTSYPVIYGAQFKKDSKGRILVDEDPNSLTYGMPIAGDVGVIGNVSPDFILGGGTTFTYKALSLSAVFEWKAGGQMYSGMNGMMDFYGVSKRTEDRESPFIFKGYKADGTPNDIVRGGAGDKDAYQILYSDVLGNISESFVYGNSFVKLREIALKYQLPKNFIPKIDISLSTFARNLLLWTELPNADPESSQGNHNMMGGFERFSLPQTSSYGFSININF